ncbi:MAG TPA: hypothetical protein VMS00_14905, partial [Acidimicrobiales bacterium]|nr:hypothetical protein [Acidimicrobiales bacterium]
PSAAPLMSVPHALLSGGDPRAFEHSPKVDYLLGVNIARPRGSERFGLRADGHLIEPIALVSDRAHLAQKGKNIVPLNVVANRMAENSLHCGPMMGVQLWRFCHVRLLGCPDLVVLLGNQSGLLTFDHTRRVA